MLIIFSLPYLVDFVSGLCTFLYGFLLFQTESIQEKNK